jgi:DNA-binding NtrC family response regulator
MAKSKTSTRILNRVFDKTSSPVYLVSPDNQISYANQACANWVGVEVDELKLASCVFTSTDSATETKLLSKIQGLTPDPRLTEKGKDIAWVRSVVFATNDQGEKTWRLASMTPLSDADQNSIGVLVVCESKTHHSPPVEQEKASKNEDRNQMHVALAEIRTSIDQAHSMESLVGSSPFANRIRRQVETAIAHNSDLLIHGPPGTGKEHLARTIHAARDKNNETELISIHCSIADQKLIQQNIKDIVSTRTPASNNDWLLLLDVDQLGEAAQNELLGFVQLPNFRLQIIATSSQNLIELANQKAYATELAYYMSPSTIELPTLAQRLEDIPFLAQALLERDNHRRERQLSGFSIDVMQQFAEYNWPENIDELNRTIQLAAQTCSSSQIETSDLPDEFRNAMSALRIGTRVETEINLEQFLGQVEKELIARAIKQAKDNKTKAAKLLGISRPKLLRRLQHFELDASEAKDGNSDQLDPSVFEELDS